MTQPFGWAEPAAYEFDLRGAQDPSGLELDDANIRVSIADLGTPLPQFNFDGSELIARWGHVASAAPSCDLDGCLALNNNCRDEAEVALAVDTSGADKVFVRILEGGLLVEAFNEDSTGIFSEFSTSGNDAVVMEIPTRGSDVIGLRFSALEQCLVGAGQAIVDSIWTGN